MDVETREEIAKWGRDLVISVIIVPAILAWFNMSPAVWIIGGLCALIALRIWERHPKYFRERVNIAAAAGLLFCVGACIAIWYFSPQRAAQRAIAAAASPLDNTIILSCDAATRPTIAPQYKIFEIQLSYEFSAGGGALLGFSQNPGETLDWGGDNAPLYGWRCRLSNSGKVVAVGVQIPFQINFHELVKIENGWKAGKILRTNTLSTIPLTLGPSEEIDFYLLNFSSDTDAEIILPKEATGAPAGETIVRPFKLVLGTFGGFYLQPFTPKPKSPPEPTHQTPKPVAQPKTK
jgi:hypothetical protein